MCTLSRCRDCCRRERHSTLVFITYGNLSDTHTHFQLKKKDTPTAAKSSLTCLSYSIISITRDLYSVLFLTEDTASAKCLESSNRIDVTLHFSTEYPSPPFNSNNLRLPTHTEHPNNNLHPTHTRRGKESILLTRGD